MRKLLYLVCGLALIAGSAHAQRNRVAHASGVLAIPAEDPADSLYRLARNAMSSGDYRKAATMFQQLVEKYPSSKKVADALYWRSYSLYQLGNDSRSTADYGAALASLDRLTKDLGKTVDQANDAVDLYSRIRAAQAKLGDADAARDISKSAKQLGQAKGCSGSRVDEETRMAALEGLLSMNSDDAVPILKSVLKQRDECRVELRKKAVWLIAQKRAPDIVATLLDVARTDPSMDVRSDAVFWLSSTRSELVIPALDSILFSAGDDEVRKKAIFSLAQQRDESARQSLRKAIEDERLPEELRGEAVFWLGNTPSNANLDYFKTLFKKTRNIELRSKVVQAVSNTPTPEATNWLLDIARDKSFDTETRKNAIFWVSQRRTFDFDQLATIYDQAKGDDEIQKQVLFVYSTRREPAAVDKLMTVAKSDPSVEMRKQALFWLGQKNDPRVKQFILDLINK